MNNNRRHRFIDFIKKHWNPEKIHPPKVDPDLEDLEGVQRASEVIRHSIRSAEFWLSPQGSLREWFKLNGKISAVLIIPAIIVMPLVSLILWQVAKWLGWLVGIAGHLIMFPLVALAGIAVSLVVVAILRAFIGK